MKKERSLYEAGGEGLFEVVSVPDIKLLENLGVRIGTKLKIQKRYALSGPVLLRIENTYSIAVGKDIAVQIGVVPAREGRV
jgi:Fe2+ transport system protein FeoA